MGWILQDALLCDPTLPLSLFTVSVHCDCPLSVSTVIVYCPLSLSTVTVHCVLSTVTVHCHCVLSTVTVHCVLSTVTVHCVLSTVYCPLADVVIHVCTQLSVVGCGMHSHCAFPRSGHVEQRIYSLRDYYALHSCGFHKEMSVS